MALILEEDREILIDFINESNEALEKTELVLLGLEEALAENNAIDVNKINTIFRTFHSIKGSAGFIGLVATNKLTHEAETLLDLIRKDKIEIRKEHIDIFLEVSDTLMMMMNHLYEHFTEENFPADTQALCDNIISFINSDNADVEQEKKSDSKKVEPNKTSTKSKSAGKKSKNNSTAKTDKQIVESLITPEMEKQFVVDSTDLLDSLEQDLLVLEKESGNNDLIESAFRNLHSLKGNAGFFNFTDINQICHKAETFLDKARTGLVVVDAKQISLILQVLDFIRAAIDNLDSGKPPLIMGKVGLMDLMSEVFGDEAEHENSRVEKQTEITGSDSELEIKVEKKEDFESKISEKLDKVKTGDKSNSSKSTSEVIRVDVNKLNKLMDLVGEIVISESMVSHNPDLKGMELENFEKSISYLQKNVRELQELATSMRMIPLNGVFGKMKRLIRDLSSKNNKKIELVIDGGETEVDRSVLEHISDPLVHILRNAADHGIEKPEDREKKGKPALGKIDLSAKQIGGEICIIIKDDGAGLSREKIINKAIEKGILSDTENDIPDEKVWNLIFAPGFSTAAKVSDISGRGVGMDVVVRNVEKIRGKVEVKSEDNIGTTIELRIPLTTAIVDGMILRVENAIYAIPTLDIRESLQINDGKVIDLIDGQEVIKIRDKMVPVLRLHELHELSFEQKPLSEGIVVVTEKGGQGIGFLVDEILGQQQLVIKALPSYLGKIDGVSGCAILGDGAICQILDLANLVKSVESVVN
jgi:two-component system chemotaxis sensor kinase CheA